ncbi:hypothetical protein GCM10010124_31850 [Pilimelia terevasa]|uniref:Uncharacterized protein n=1 Tax=Pilimelia terevasa TaxID=53372 RepID=A0A8J3BSN7_9ACTN|nr:hypothetical protein [Pilimelia terevasa]GGK36809.1 hypothetical protein GCM10010124_31850 [Pilimelia terevasa]
MKTLHTAKTALARLRTRLDGPERRDRGAETIQTVIITAGLALLALLVIAAIKGGVGKFIDVINGLTP